MTVTVYPTIFPSYIQQIFEEKFNAEQIKTLNNHWGDYSNGFRFSSATKAQIIKEAKMVLACAAD